MAAERLLSNTRGGARRRRGRDPQGLPEACAQASSGSESRRQGGRGPLQESPGSLRHSERSEEEADVRSVRLLFGKRHAGGRAGRPGAQRGPNMGFGGFDFSDVFTRRRRAVRGGAPARIRANPPIFRTFSASGSAASMEPQATAPRKGHRSRIRPEHRFLAGDPRHAGAPEHHPPGSLRDLRRHRRAQPAPTRSARSATAAAT